MKAKQLNKLKRSILEAFMDESRYAWECGLQSQSGPISEEKARELVNKLFKDCLDSPNEKNEKNKNALKFSPPKSKELAVVI